MCGLVGAVGRITIKEEEAVRTLLMLDTMRGPHSTGLAFIHHKDKPIIAKSEGTPWDLATKDEYQKGFARANSAIIGHNRWATRGVINEKNSHPFQHGHIIGAHNGTLDQQSLLLNYKDFEVDSDNIFFDMSVSGHLDTIKRLNGAFALSWYDAVEEKIYLARNDKRPLSFVFTKDSKTVFWASESWMLDVALSRVGLDFHGIKELEEGHLASFDVPNDYPSNVKPYKEYGSEKLELFKYPLFRYRNQDVWNNYHEKDKSEEKKGENEKEEKRGNVLPFRKGTTDALLKTYLNRTIEFFVSEEVRKPAYGNKQPYILCKTQDENEVDVRIYQEPGSALWKKLASSEEWFKAEVKSATFLGGNSGYLTIDYRTINPVEFKDLSIKAVESLGMFQVKFTGFEGRELTREQFVELTNKGCALCTDIVPMSKANSIVWVSHDEHFCSNCAISDFARQYLEKDTATRSLH